jgi:type I restriction enzyme S subunit
MSWEYKTLDQLGEVSRGRSKHRPRNDPSLFGGEYPFIQTADVKAANFYITEYDTTYNEKGLAQSKLWHPGTLCITIAANIADTGILAMDACFPDSVMGFIPYDEVADVRFVKYCFDILQQNCKKISQGAAQDNLSWEKLSTILFPAPPVAVQKKIADILSSFDDLIENNQKQIKLLEETAQRLYKEWFVDLRFPGYENTPIVDGVPEGWKYRPLSEVFDFVRGKSYSSKELSDTTGVLMVNLKNIRPFGGYNRSAEKRFTGQFKENQTLTAGDVVMGVTDMTQERRLVGHVALVPDMGEAMTFSMDLIKIIPKLANRLFIYSALYYGGLSKQISPLANGVNVLHLKPEAMMGIEMLIPCTEILRIYHDQIAPIIARIEVLQKQCNIAAEARDRLLPKLMNGEIEV